MVLRLLGRLGLVSPTSRRYRTASVAPAFALPWNRQTPRATERCHWQLRSRPSFAFVQQRGAGRLFAEPWACSSWLCLAYKPLGCGFLLPNSPLALANPASLGQKGA
uniref:Uncharacterized protein n=1 Tax=uncultured marine virus TaxID=186617 RepID=A0A0F7L4R6_9VIRU|nr:hypothetical protein [uncultured marine virus]